VIFDRERYEKTMRDTGPDKLADLPIETLQACYHYLTEAQRALPAMYGAEEIRPCSDRVALLRSEIELRRVEKQSGEQHTESMKQGSNILFWAKVGGIAAAVGTLVLLSQDLPISRLRPAKASQALPTSSPKITPTAVPSESTSATPQASPTPAPTSTPK
jgi:hypothetical protein